MSVTECVVQGTLNPDGTLHLDRKPDLAPGRVTIVLRLQAAGGPASGGDWFRSLQEARQRLEESGASFLDEKDLQAHLDWLREGDRIDDLLREADQRPQEPERP